jgi:hypothetical protein
MMLRLFFIFSMFFSIAACSAHDEQYYATHPKKLQQAIDRCPSEPPQQLSCEQLAQLVLRINDYALDVRMHPQSFGKKILSLQETIAKQESDVKRSPKDDDLRQALRSNQKQLKERLAVVGWLLAPG